MPSAVLATPNVESAPKADGLLRMLMGFEASQVLMVSHHLGVFATLAVEAASAENVCQRLGLPLASGERLLYACVALGLLLIEDKKLSNSPLADLYLVPGKTSYLGGLVEYYQGEFYTVYSRLDRAIQENRPQVGENRESTTDIFAAGEKEPALQQRFLEAMHRLGLWEGDRLAALFPFKQINVLMDVGGGSGALSTRLANHFPHLRISLFDRPSVCLCADAFIKSDYAGSQITLHPGDFWADELPRGADAILLSMILHDWSPAKSLRLLQRCHDALPSGGRILLYEQLLDENRCGPLVTCLTNITMLLRTESGTEYTEMDFRQLLQKAGFTTIEVVRTQGLRQLIHAIKP